VHLDPTDRRAWSQRAPIALRVAAEQLALLGELRAGGARASFGFLRPLDEQRVVGLRDLVVTARELVLLVRKKSLPKTAIAY
jgi:hypothetical protein